MNPQEDPDMPLEEVEDDGGEEFINMAEAVEVIVDDNDVPMDEDDEEEEQDGDQFPSSAAPVVDMAKLVIESHSDHVYSVASHYDTPSRTLYIISGAGDDKAFLHKIGDNATTTTTPLSHVHKDSVSCAAFNMAYVSDDLTKTPVYAAVGAYDGAIVIYDPQTGTKLQELEGPSDVEFLSFHPKGGSVLLAGSGEDGTVWMYHLPTSKCLQVFVGHESGVTAGAFTPDGKWALSASSDGTLRVWAPRTGVNKHVFRTGQSALTCLATGGGTDKNLVMVGAENGIAHVCHVVTKKVLATLRHVEVPTDGKHDNEEIDLALSVEAVGFSSSNANWCATGGVDGQLKIWDLANGFCRQICSFEKAGEQQTAGGITRLQWHPTLPLVYTAASDGVVRIWDARNGNLVTALTGHSDMINDMSICCGIVDGKDVVVSGSDDNSVRVFEVDIAAAVAAQGGN
jgi:WD40 repeat protein